MENRNEGRKVASRPCNSRVVTTTKPTATGAVVPVTDHPDLWYLCEKANYAQRFPYVRSGDNRAMYQRRVSYWARLDNENFEYRFPYCGEVGFNMAHRPPSPVMSLKEPYRPSTFPLSKYSLMRNKLLDGLSALFLEYDLLDKREVEVMLARQDLEDGERIHIDRRITRILEGGHVKGLLRIPDIVRLRTFHEPGVAQYSQGNLQSVIEMKFPGDVLSPAQQEAYELIAGPAGLRVMYTETCECADREQWREWVRVSEKEPVYKPIQQVTRLGSRMSIEKNKLLVARIDAEHDAVRRLLGVQGPEAQGPQWVGMTDSHAAQASNRRSVAGMEMVLAAPFVAVGSVAVAALAAPGSALSSGSTVAQSAGQTVTFRAVLEAARKWVPASVGGAAPAMASEAPDRAKSSTVRERNWSEYELPSLQKTYVLWENAAVNVYE
ncbi:VRR-NUC domain-containing protein [Pseudomonas sp. microsymbiont 2]